MTLPTCELARNLYEGKTVKLTESSRGGTGGWVVGGAGLREYITWVTRDYCRAAQRI